ncbi:hypothetical protein CK203_086193 [Vitis vinifera]|uniref:DUF4218 domain-containing protein n=1 Tax=Vitis vinifera TaxID=29760 RepID=A0A438DXA8_VITVI|nr:hypothetical protein CK203_086193 [Vitis vinifera]
MLGNMLPMNNELPLSMNELKDASSCPTCGTSRWKTDKQELKRGRGSNEKRDFDGKMRHPSDSPSWKLVDHRWLEFSSEPRNLRLAISADGINPHSPRQPGNDIDIYLAPLIEDLKTLWEVGVQAYDAHQREFFTLRAVLLWTISDFPAYGNLSGCTVKGYFGKTKDGLNCRLDLVDMGLRSELAPKFESKRTDLPPACYSLSKMEKKVFCQTLSQLKVSYGYCSNLRNLVSMEDLKLYGLKSHDYHTLMQQLLPVSLRYILPKHVRNAICRLSSFFNTLYSKVVDVPTLDELQNEVVVTLCLFEKYFPPSFFDIMVHLTVHLVREVRLCGPVTLGGCTHLKVLQTLTKKVGASIFGGHTMKVDSNLWLQAHHYVLENTTIIQPYVEDHMKWLKNENIHVKLKDKSGYKNEHMRTFTYWLRQKVEVAIGNEEPVSETLKWIAHGFQSSSVIGVDNKNGIKVDDLGFTLVDFSKMAHKSDPFILASQAKQVSMYKMNLIQDGMDLEQEEKPPTKGGVEDN